MSHSYSKSVEGYAVSLKKQNEEMKDSIQSLEYEIAQFKELLDTMDPFGSVSVETVKSMIRQIEGIL